MTTDHPPINIVLGASGGIGEAVMAELTALHGPDRVLGLSRSTGPAIDLLKEETIAAAAAQVKAMGHRPDLVFDATGVLSWPGHAPEKSWRSLDPDDMAMAFRINAAGPALIMKHFLPLLPRTGRAVFATLSARVGSIGDNRIGGWYAYRASKAALNQLVRCASIELARTRKDAICVALHPGTVATPLSDPFAKQGLNVQTPQQSARRLLQVIKTLTPADTGGFFDHLGKPIPW
ncbi:SDR family oxidoreductase [Roseibium aquae]|uniref:SDR family oxidoreductase n=1 Tax=Roseibium aquae TaxID=1323746 RepID=A0A916TNA0_9HYPH|nr:SDR family oxidoreductase [Roseibium aquae]GGB61809.1 SDR family oxidoreductase [Roseibium aquae]